MTEYKYTGPDGEVFTKVIENTTPRPSPAENSAFKKTLPLARESIALVFLTLIADWCLYFSMGGAGLGALTIISGAVFVALRANLINWQTIALMGMLVSLSVILFWSPWWLPVLMSISTLALLAVNRWEPTWSWLESGWNLALAPFRAFGRLLDHAGNLFKLIPASSRIPKIPARIILVPLGITGLFLMIFINANPVFQRIYSNLSYMIEFVVLGIPDYFNISRIAFWIVFLPAFAILLRPIRESGLVKKSLAMPVIREFVDCDNQDDLNYRTALATLISLNLLFLVYNSIDAVYLYFKATLPAGMNWSEYTHAGCGWLTFALFLSSVVLGTIFWNKLNFHLRSILLKNLGYIWILQNGLLGIGALRRIYMYIDFSGLTHLIITGVYGSLLVMAGLVIMARKVQMNYSAIWLLRSYVTAFYLGLFALAITPYGYVCAAYNVPRVLEDKPRALWPILLKDLPPDAMPHAVRLLEYKRFDQDHQKTQDVRKGIAANLQNYLKKIEDNQRLPWQQRELSAAWALKHMKPLERRLWGICHPDDAESARQYLLNDYELMNGSPRRDLRL
jgi:hypothetical protein